MHTAFLCSDYYEDSVPTPSHPLTVTVPDGVLDGHHEGEHDVGSHVHLVPFDGIGAQLFPCSLVTTTPQTFIVTSVSANPGPTRSCPSPPGNGHALLTGPDPPGSSRRSN